MKLWLYICPGCCAQATIPRSPDDLPLRVIVTSRKKEHRPGCLLQFKELHGPVELADDGGIAVSTS